MLRNCPAIIKYIITPSLVYVTWLLVFAEPAKLTQSRLDVINTILGVDMLLCAIGLFINLTDKED